jgi:hypothetical protein
MMADLARYGKLAREPMVDIYIIPEYKHLTLSLHSFIAALPVIAILLATHGINHVRRASMNHPQPLK